MYSKNYLENEKKNSKITYHNHLKNIYSTNRVLICLQSKEIKKKKELIYFTLKKNYNIINK